MEAAENNEKVGSVKFTDDEIETIKKLIRDRGFEYGLESDAEKVDALAAKLGMPIDLLGKARL